MRLPGLMLVAAALAACGASPSAVHTKDDPFRPHREIMTGILRAPAPQGMIAFQLVAEIDRKSGQTTTLLKVHHTYQGRHRNNYQSARNAKAEALAVTVVARHGNCHAKPSCPIEELYKVTIPEAELRAAGTSGYALKVFPNTGPDVLIMIPQEMIASFAALLDKERGGTVAAVAPLPGTAAAVKAPR